jgi:assimilatory nitrate reductase catalytic subunit
MRSDDAARAGLAEGDHVEIANERGAVRAWLKVSDVLHPGVVALPGKWWGEPAETSALANLLSGPAWAPHGQPAYNDVSVEVRQAVVPDLAPAARAPAV